MLEMKITVTVPDLSAAFEKLAAAIAARDCNARTPDAQVPTAPAQVPAPVPTATGPAPANVPVAVAASQPAAPAVPVADPPAYTLDQISNAGAALVDAGRMEQLLALLGKYGVQAVTQLAPSQYGAFATELRALGAQI